MVGTFIKNNIGFASNVLALVLFLIIVWQVYKNKLYYIGFIYQLSIVLFIAKIPVLIHNQFLNLDESICIGQAQTLLNTHTFLWQRVDPLTVGPLHIYLITLIKFLGFKIDYISVRILYYVLLQLCMVVFYQVLKQLHFNKIYIYWAFLISAPFFLLSYNGHFNHYASPLISILFTGLAILCMNKSGSASTKQLLYTFFLGFCAAIAIFGKFQVLPFSGLIIVAALFFKTNPRTETKGFLKYFVVLSAGFLLPILIFVGQLWSLGLWGDYLDFQIRTNFFGYSSNNNSIWRYADFFFKFGGDSNETSLLGFIVLVILISIIGFWKKLEKSFNLVFALLLIFCSVFAIGKTGFSWGLYYWYAFFPILLLICYALAEVSKHHKFNPLVMVGIVLCNLFAAKYYTSSAPPLPQKNVKKFKTSSFIQEITQPDESITVFSLESNIYVESERPQATRINFPTRLFEGDQINNKEVIAFHRKAFIEDLLTNKPAVIVECEKCVGSHDLVDFPELHQIIKRDYTKVRTFNEDFNPQLKTHHVFVLNSKLPSIKQKF